MKALQSAARGASAALSTLASQLPQTPATNFRKYTVDLYKSNGVAIVEGQGSTLKDAKGKSYVDLLSNWGSNAFGHGGGHFDGVFKAISAGKLPMVYTAFDSPDRQKAGQRISEKTAECLGGKPEDRGVYFSNSGAEAGEASVKFSRHWGEKVKGIPQNQGLIFGFTGNFHGRAAVGTALFDGSNPASKDGLGPFLPGIKLLPWNDPQAASEQLALHRDRAAAVIIEPIQGEGGINWPSPEFMKTLAESCKRENVLLVADEVQSGMYRSGPLWASKHFGVDPDILLSGKIIGGGLYPVSGLVMKNKVADLLKPGGIHGSTFGGNPIAIAFVNRTQDLMEEQNIPENVQRMGAVLKQGLLELQKRHPDVIQGIRGAGLWYGIEIDPALDVAGVGKTLMKHGVLTGGSGKNVLRVSPALNITEKEIAQGLQQLDIGLKAVEQTKGQHLKAPAVAQSR